MRYMVQSTHRNYSPDDWRTISSQRAGHQETDDLETARRMLKYNADLSRCIWPMRVIDEDGFIHAIYDPERDMRLPGCRYRMIQRNAYALWEEAGRPESDGIEFWLTAEAELPKADGVLDVYCHCADSADLLFPYA